MHGWLGVVEILGVLIALLAISLLMLAGRRRWIDRLGGTFDCSLRLRMTTPGAGWVLGVARLARESWSGSGSSLTRYDRAWSSQGAT